MRKRTPEQVGFGGADGSQDQRGFFLQVVAERIVESPAEIEQQRNCWEGNNSYTCLVRQ
jgi:hypothetical protein